MHITEVAKYILQRLGSMETAKLQKLCYYSQVWTLAWYGEELFEEDFKAWETGAVCEDLTEIIGNGRIVTESDINVEVDKEGIEKYKEVIDKVLDYYKRFTGQWLCHLTQIEKPWREARKNNIAGVMEKRRLTEYYRGIEDEHAFKPFKP